MKERLRRGMPIRLQEQTFFSLPMWYHRNAVSEQTTERKDTMPVQVFYDGGSRTVLAELSGDIDHCSARGLRTPIDEEIMRRLPQRLILDFENVGFMDSSGIGLIIGRCKLMTDLGGSVITVNPKPEIRKLMELAGVQRLCGIVTEKRYSLTGGLTI